MASFVIVFRILLVAGMSALVPNLKGGSLTRPISDPTACAEAFHAGAECTQCATKFKLCRGHFVYEPFTVVLFEAVVTILVGVVVAYIVVGDRHKATHMLTDWRSLRRVAPIGATYALADLMDLAAARNCSATTLLVASQMRLPLCALLRSLLLGRSQTRAQWSLLFGISLLCVLHVCCENKSGGETAGVAATAAAAAGAAVGAATGADAAGGLAAAGAAWVAWVAAAASDDLLGTLPLLMGKCIISCSGAVHAEFFLQHEAVQQVPLWVTQVHFKIATMFGALSIGFMHGRRGGRIFASTWDADLFTQMPPSTRAGDARVPFFGGWNEGTWALLVCLVMNNFLIGDQLRRLTSVAKYVAYAFGMVVSYVVQLYSGRELDPLQAVCCGGIAALAVAYVQLPGPTKAPSKAEVAASVKKCS